METIIDYTRIWDIKTNPTNNPDLFDSHSMILNQLLLTRIEYKREKVKTNFIIEKPKLFKLHG